jgi:hypothetical protein
MTCFTRENRRISPIFNRNEKHSFESYGFFWLGLFTSRDPPNQIDYTLRMREFFDHHLKGKPAPKWLKEGIPHLKIKEHIREHAKKARQTKR